MKAFSGWVFIICSFLLVNCHTDVETQYPNEPSIEFKEVRISKTDPVTQLDTLSVTILIRDGNFDLGLNTDGSIDPKPPYHILDYFNKTTGSKVPSGEGTLDVTKLVTYKDKRLHRNDTLPGYVQPFFCTRWISYPSTGPVTDTLYYQKNQFFYNYRIYYYFLENGSWKKFDFESTFATSTNCYLSFNGRFSPFLTHNQVYKSGPFTLKRLSSQEGMLTYDMKSQGFRQIFGNKKLKLRISIVDLALNRSNEIETTEFNFN